MKLYNQSRRMGNLYGTCLLVTKLKLSGKRDTESPHGYYTRAGRLCYREHYGDMLSSERGARRPPHLHWYSVTPHPYKTGELSLCVLCLTLAM